jgi:hypothetical protein
MIMVFSILVLFVFVYIDSDFVGICHIIIMGIDFKKDFKFIAKPDEYYLELTEVVIEGDYTEWQPNAFIYDGWGFFRGLTMVSYRGYDGELPRMDGDTASFSEFYIYYKDEILSEETKYVDLLNLIKSEERDSKINQIID